jgi:hypothetical protein
VQYSPQCLTRLPIPFATLRAALEAEQGSREPSGDPSAVRITRRPSNSQLYPHCLDLESRSTGIEPVPLPGGVYRRRRRSVPSSPVYTTLMADTPIPMSERYCIELKRFFAALSEPSCECWQTRWESSLERLLPRNYLAWVYVTRAAKELETTLPSDFDLLEEAALAYGAIDRAWILVQRRRLDREDAAREARMTAVSSPS